MGVVWTHCGGSASGILSVVRGKSEFILPLEIMRMTKLKNIYIVDVRNVYFRYTFVI